MKSNKKINTKTATPTAGTKKGVTTDSDGRYVLNKSVPKRCTLMFSFTGTKNEMRTADLYADKTHTVDLCMIVAALLGASLLLTSV